MAEEYDPYEPVEPPDWRTALGASAADWLWGVGGGIVGQVATGDSPFLDWWERTDNPSETLLGTGLNALGSVIDTGGQAVQTADEYLPDPDTVADTAKAAVALFGLYLAVRLVRG